MARIFDRARREVQSIIDREREGENIGDVMDFRMRSGSHLRERDRGNSQRSEWLPVTINDVDALREIALKLRTLSADDLGCDWPSYCEEFADRILAARSPDPRGSGTDGVALIARFLPASEPTLSEKDARDMVNRVVFAQTAFLTRDPECSEAGYARLVGEVEDACVALITRLSKPARSSGNEARDGDAT